MSKARRSRSALVILLVGVFTAWWGVSVFTQTNTPVVISSSFNSDMEISYAGEPIVVHSKIANGVASYSGQLALPSACDTLGSGIAAKGQNPAHVTVLFTLTQPQTGCAAAESLTMAPFAVSVSVAQGASKPVFDGVTVNGVIVLTTVVQSN